MKIGIIGENIENDSKPLKLLLEKKYDTTQHRFIPILKNFKGSDIARKNNRAVKNVISTVKKKKKLDFIIFMRDLDALPSNGKAIDEKETWFQALKTTPRDLFFLIIYELEALIFADIETFNKKYNTRLSQKGNPLFIEKPKEKLVAASLGKNQYKENHAQNIFKDLDFDKIYTLHHHRDYPCFQSFINQLDKTL